MKRYFRFCREYGKEFAVLLRDIEYRYPISLLALLLSFSPTLYPLYPIPLSFSSLSLSYPFFYAIYHSLALSYIPPFAHILCYLALWDPGHLASARSGCSTKLTAGYVFLRVSEEICTMWKNISYHAF